MRLLLLDNYDSFTWNLADHLTVSGAEVLVYRNDAITIEGIRKLGVQGIVLSPGPGKPAEAGILMEVVDTFHAELPILGICLGYQAIGIWSGARLVHSPVPVHGKTSDITHTGTGIFSGVPDPCAVMRYHSLNIADIPESLEITAHTLQGNEPMALRHTRFSMSGVQFHPESIGTPDGLRMLQNWLKTLL